MDDNAKELARRGAALFAKKEPLDALNQEIAEQFYPERADFTGARVLGEEFATHLFDSSPVLARRDLCNSFQAITRPRGQQWFKAMLADEQLMDMQPVQAALDIITKTMRKLIYRQEAQFGRATKEADHDYGTFGNAGIWLGEPRRRPGLLYRCFHLRDLAWVEGPDGDIRDGGALWRKFKMSARNMNVEYRGVKFDRVVENAIEKEPDREFELCHVMIPTDEYYGSRERPWGKGKMTWASIWYDHEHCTILREEGSDDFRYIIPRWQTIPGSQYAVSPAALTSLPNARGLQTMARVLLEAGEKAVDPPMKAVDGAVIGGINLFSGGVTWIEREYNEKEGSPVEPILLGKQVGIGADLLMLARQELKDCWYLNKMSMPQVAGDRTATEVIQWTEDYIRSNIPLFEPVEATYNLPTLDLTLKTAMRFSRPIREAVMMIRSIIGDNEDLDIEFGFSNPLQEMIERNKTNQFNILLGAVAGASEIDPTVREVHDWPGIVRDLTPAINAPATWNRNPEEEKARRQAAQQTGDIIGGLGMAGQAADIVKTGSEAAANLQTVFAPQISEAA